MTGEDGGSARTRGVPSGRDSEARFRAIFESSGMGIALVDLEGRPIESNPALQRILGYSGEELARMPFTEFTHPDDRSVDWTLYRELVDGKRPRYEIEKRYVRKDGRVIWARLVVSMIHDEQGAPLYAVGMVEDVTERKLAEERLRWSEERLHTATESASIGVWDWDVTNDRIVWDDTMYKLYGIRSEDFGGAYDAWVARLVPGDRERSMRLVRAALEGGREFDPEFEIQWPDGSTHILRAASRVIRDAAGRPVRMVGVNYDITARTRAAEELRDSETRFRALCENALIGIYIVQDGLLTYVNPSLERSLGYAPGEMLGKESIEFVHPDDRAIAAAMLQNRLERGLDSTRYEMRLFRKGGEVLTVEVFGAAVQLGGRSAMIGNMLDITARRRAEAALRESEQRFRQIADSIDEVFWLFDPRENRMLYVSPAFERIWGRPSSALYASPAVWLDAIHADDRERIEQAVPTKRMQSGFDETYRIVRPDGDVRWIRERAFQLRKSSGDDVRIVGTATDVTEHQNLETQLRQAQKMEAVGVLAGGIAHDFNNILAIIMSYSSMSLARLDELDPLFSPMQEIQAAAQRASGLTKQLLAFSRRQTLHLQTVDLGTIVAGAEKMLRRLIGEDVELHTAVASAPAWVRVDPGQMEQVLLNLAVNARDAMPRGGRLTIETGQVDVTDADAAKRGLKPGSHALLTVVDTGVGMDAETQSRIFEPFFTTKAAGKGTGLGLSTAFGIVQQSNGQIAVDSSPGHGATFRIWLPLSTSETASTNTAPKRELRGRETVLLVEDDAHVRKLARTVLSQHGYRVLEASGGGDAILIVEQYGETIDVVLTDIVMPLLSGDELMRRLRVLRPNLRVVYMSGYPDRGTVDEISPSGRFVAKPFTPDELLRGIRDALAEPVQSEPPARTVR